MPTTDKRPLKVFLCHASTDKPKVRELYRYLKKRGIQPWFDEEDLVGGQDWQVEIPKALATSDAIIICLTTNSVDKEGYIQKEIKFALDKALEMPEGRIFLIPVKFEECEVPFTLSRYQWVDLTVESGYAKMMKALKFRASQLERSTVEVSKKNVEEEIAAREAARKTAHEKAEKDAIEKERLEAEKQARIKAERKTAEKAAREKTEKETIEKAVQEKALSSFLQKRHLVKKEYVVALMGAGAIIIGFLFNSPLLARTSNATQATFVTTQTPSTLPTNTYTPAYSPSGNPTSTSTSAPTPLPEEIHTNSSANPLSEAGWLVSFSREGILTLLNMTSQQSENLLEFPDCDEKPLWYPEENFFVICSRLFEFDMGKVNELPTNLPERTKEKISLLDKVVYSTEAMNWYNGRSSIISIEIPSNIKDVIVDFETTDVTHKKVTNSEFVDTYTKQVFDLISVSPSNEYLLFTRTPMVVQERKSNINGVVPENPYAILEIRPTKFIAINLSSREIRELYCDNFYYWNAQSDIVTCENGSHVIATASRTNTPYSVLDEYVIDFSSWSRNFLYMGFISDGNLYIYDIEQDKVSQLTRSNDIVDFSWSSNSNYLLAINGDVYLFDTNSGQVVYSLETPREEISAIWMP